MSYIKYDINDNENPGLEILPCPFCGSSAETLPQANGWLMIKCRNHVCGASIKEYTNYEIQVMAKWNTRALPNGHVVSGINPEWAYDENGKAYKIN